MKINNSMSLAQIQNLINTSQDKTFDFAPGTYNWSDTLVISRSGVTLRRDSSVSGSEKVNIVSSKEGNAIEIKRVDFSKDQKHSCRSRSIILAMIMMLAMEFIRTTSSLSESILQM